MRIVFEQKQEYFDFVNKILMSDFETTRSRCMTTLSNDGDIFGVVVFDRFSLYSCELNVASVSPRWLTKRLLGFIFDYIFNVCGRIRATTIVDSRNEKSLRLQKWMGFVEEARLKNIYGEGDGVVFRMLRNECKWIEQ